MNTVSQNKVNETPSIIYFDFQCSNLRLILTSLDHLRVKDTDTFLIGVIQQLRGQDEVSS